MGASNGTPSGCWIVGQFVGTHDDGGRVSISIHACATVLWLKIHLRSEKRYISILQHTHFKPHHAMCGIFCAIRRDRFHRLDSTSQKLLKARGPDSYQEHGVKISGRLDSEVYLTFASSVLSLRGRALVSQPLVDQETSSVLCWNGEAWAIDGEGILDNDTESVFQLLLQAAKGKDPHASILKALSNIQGPFAFVFLDFSDMKLYFGRDCLGRRSLVKSVLKGQGLCLASVADLSFSKNCPEVEADGVYVIDLDQFMYSTESAPAANISPSFHDAYGESHKIVSNASNLSCSSAHSS
jgi:asparagine synthetase B (glutamine-hydrolysing)